MARRVFVQAPQLQFRFCCEPLHANDWGEGAPAAFKLQAGWVLHLLPTSETPLLVLRSVAIDGL